jgi:RNA polymerase sigma-70 factor (ECF subfamily)
MTAPIETQTASLTGSEFKEKLVAGIPHLRAFARSLCGNGEMADDLVQETMLKAWAARDRFAPDTNFKAWTFTILRNQYFSQYRRKRFVAEWDDHLADRVLAAPASQEAIIDLQDLMRGLQQIPATQREALILVAAGGFSYEEVAEIVGVADGTVKSRVCRARTALQKIMSSGVLRTSRQDLAAGQGTVLSLLAYLEKLQTRAPRSGSSAASRAQVSRIAA